MGFAAFVFGQSTDVQLKTKFLTLLAEDIAREKQRVGKISFPDTKEGSIMQIFKVGGSWVVTFSIRDRADRDIFRRVLGEQVGFVVILFVQIITKYLLELIFNFLSKGTFCCTQH